MEGEEESEIKIELEIVKENWNQKVENNRDNKKNKLKKIKIRKNRGEKRKISDKIESCKKIKINKKDERPARSDLNSSAKGSNIDDGKESGMPFSTVLPQSTPKFKSKREPVGSAENDSDAENQETLVKEKSKQMSAKKSRAIKNACKETLEVLMRLGLDTLGSMDKSLKILKSHNFLNNKLVPIDMLMELVALAIDTSKTSEAEKELDLSNVISKLALDIYVTPKTSKVKQSFLPGSDSPKTISTGQEDLPIYAAVLKRQIQDKETGKNEGQEEEIDECAIILETQARSQESIIQKSGKNFCITNYFKKLQKTEKEEENKNERFSCFRAKTNMYLAPKLGGELTGTRRQKFEEEFTNQTCEANYLVKRSSGSTHKNSRICSNETSLNHSEVEERNIGGEDLSRRRTSQSQAVIGTGTRKGSECVEVKARKKIAPTRVGEVKMVSVQTVTRMKAKLLQFHENKRPPYWGTWRRKSETVGARKPFARDKMFNYDVDSDDEWDGEEEPGESLHGSDDEKEPEEDYEVDNEFFVPHGYLSDDENPEKEAVSSKVKLTLLEEQFSSDQKQKTRKMAPLVFGTFWIHKSLPPQGTLFRDLQLQRLHVIPWFSLPIQIEKGNKKKKESTCKQKGEPTSQMKKARWKATFPEEEIAYLIKMIHGSPQNSDLLAKKFILYWETEKSQGIGRPNLPKICVLKKIKELAAWQNSKEIGKMCWVVPKETRKEFGVEVEEESSSSKLQKSFIWKFLKKGDKPVLESSDGHKPQTVILES